MMLVHLSEVPSALFACTLGLYASRCSASMT